MAPMSETEKKAMVNVAKDELLSSIQKIYNNTDSGSSIVLIPSSPTNPKHYDIQMMLQGKGDFSRHLCRIINTSKTYPPYVTGDVLKSIELDGNQLEQNVCFNLIREKVGDITYLKGLFNNDLQLYKRTPFQEGWFRKSEDMRKTDGVHASDTPMKDKVKKLEEENAKMKPIYEYGQAVLNISRPE